MHSSAPAAERVDWRQIVALDDQLLVFEPTPVVALHRAVALAEVESPQRRSRSSMHSSCASITLFHAIRADLLRRLGRHVDAVSAYDAALARTSNLKERELLQRRRESLQSA